MSDNGKINKSKDLVRYTTKMAASMKDNEKTISQMVMGGSSIKMVMYMKGNSLITKPEEKGSIPQVLG